MMRPFLPRPVAVIAKNGANGIIKDGNAIDTEIRASVVDYGTELKPLAVVLVDTTGAAYKATGGASGGPGGAGFTAASTATRSSVGDSATAVTLFAANNDRLGALITNDSSARLFVGYGTTDPTTTNYTFVILPGQTWSMEEFGLYVGAIKGIWESDPDDGGARCTELSA
ncbi:MAG TPA: hypothetical protein VFS39_03805 [Nitrospira sp.]|nr:hypothetical protein [Nitrospira sp.]